MRLRRGEPLRGLRPPALPHAGGPVELAAVALPLLDVRGELAAARLEPLARLGHEAELGFEPRHFGVDLVERALGGVDRVASPVVIHAGLLEAPLDLAQPCGLGLELDRDPVDLPRHALRFVLGVALPEPPEEVLLVRGLALEGFVLAGDLGLAGELLDLRLELAADVVDPRQVLARVGEAVLGLAAPLLVLGDAGRLFQEDPQLLGLGLDHPRDHSLLDDGVRPRPEAGAEEDVVDVAAADLGVVDVVRRLAVTLQHALDRDLGVLRPLAGGLAEAVVERELDARARNRAALRRTVEDHVLHRLAAQGARAGLAEHPAHRVDDVGLAAAVRADYADELARNIDGRRVDERLESGQFEVREAQLSTIGWRLLPVILRFGLERSVGNARVAGKRLV